MKVLLAGASGTLGRFLVPQLLAAGHEVIGTTRGARSADRLRRAGASAVVTDVLDRGALLAAVEGLTADAVVHELTSLTKAPARYGDMEPTNRLRVDGTRNLLEAARELGATRFVTQSMFLGYGFRELGREPLTEDAPFAVPTGARTDPVLAALKSTEDQTLGAGPGIEGIALRYGLFYGGDTEIYADLLRKRRLPVASGRATPNARPDPPPRRRVSDRRRAGTRSGGAGLQHRGQHTSHVARVDGGGRAYARYAPAARAPRRTDPARRAVHR